jgi:hypothetical protein
MAKEKEKEKEEEKEKENLILPGFPISRLY